MQQNAGASAKRLRRSRWYMTVAFLCIVGISAMLYLSMKQISAARAEQHKHSYMEYVTANHIGNLVEIDSGTGLDPMSYILTLSQHVADGNKASFVESQIQKYVEYDHGSMLTVVYLNPKTKKQVPVGEAHYNRVQKTLTISVTLDAGETKSIQKQVNW